MNDTQSDINIVTEPRQPQASLSCDPALLSKETGEMMRDIRETLLQHPELYQMKNIIMESTLLLEIMRDYLDNHENRFSRKYMRDIFFTYYCDLDPIRPLIRNAVWLDLGCGTQNPAAFLFSALMLGARKGIGVDLGEITDEKRVARALADCAAYLFLDPTEIVGDYPITREEMLNNIGTFDLGRLAKGDLGGIDSNRLILLRESVLNLPLETGSIDVCASNAFLEHVDGLEKAVVEMARVTRPGGMGIHGIDCTDHHHYNDPTIHPYDFYREPFNGSLAHTSNRMRPFEINRCFVENGFEILSLRVFERLEIDEELRSGFVEPWRSMAPEDLAVSKYKVIVRRRS